ncbi:hypothetical protein PUW25_25305 (plasmid) [Paenibacillus urinalis]|uniref:Uncharacterized protein n=1 Tax=Paenibacillus urinalis TaxID=521520 RepID=A0ABY7XHP8_9BACL|nr:hypothetical protein [Paenibacillus urinalis]WDI05128.1 hypothetical protein PUW25_25305 [Paenibacillus urinalis]
MNLNYPTGYDPTKDPYLDNRLRADKPITFLGFIDEMNKLWKRAEKKGSIKRHFPVKDEAEVPLITFRLIGRVIDPDYKDRKPRLRAQIHHPYVPGEIVELWGQMFLFTIQFDVHALTAEEADELAGELEDFIFMYKGYFKQNGVHELTFLQQLEDQVSSDTRVNVPIRPIQYIMRFEKITPKFLNRIEQIAVRTNDLDAQKTSQQPFKEDE